MARNYGANNSDGYIMVVMLLRAMRFIALTASLPVLILASAEAAPAVEPSVLAGSCANCHGTDGRSPGSIPSIAGLPYPVIKTKLEAFKSNPALDATLMPRLMRAYDAEQIDQLARYFSDMKPGARP